MQSKRPPWPAENAWVWAPTSSTLSCNCQPLNLQLGAPIAESLKYIHTCIIERKTMSFISLHSQQENHIKGDSLSSLLIHESSMHLCTCIWKETPSCSFNAVIGTCRAPTNLLHLGALLSTSSFCISISISAGFVIAAVFALSSEDSLRVPQIRCYVVSDSSTSSWYQCAFRHFGYGVHLWIWGVLQYQVFHVFVSLQAFFVYCLLLGLGFRFFLL